MDKELLSFNMVKPNNDLIDEIWSFEVSSIDTLSSVKLSTYIAALSQWLIYYKAQVNTTKAELSMKQSDYEIGVSAALATDPGLVKRHGTKTAAVAYLTATDTQVLGPLHGKIRNLRQDLARVDGMDKAIIEYINAFKRELDRRRHEREVARMERR